MSGGGGLNLRQNVDAATGISLGSASLKLFGGKFSQAELRKLFKICSYSESWIFVLVRAFFLGHFSGSETATLR